MQLPKLSALPKTVDIEKGYIQGTDEGKLAPKSNITRAEVVTLLSRVNN